MLLVKNLCTLDQTAIKETLDGQVSNIDHAIDGLHFGRGHEYYCKETNLKYQYKTERVTCWLIQNNELIEVTTGVFYDKETYLTKWEVLINKIDHTNDSAFESATTTIFFYWSGKEAIKGQSPLPHGTPEAAPVLRITQWSEPTVFLRVFNQNLIINKGKHDTFDKDQPHLYLLRGEVREELYFCEVPLQNKNLRFGTSLLVVSIPKNDVLIWHGPQTPLEKGKSIKHVLENNAFLKQFKILIREESSWTSLFSFTEPNICSECSFEDVKPLQKSPRLFYFFVFNDDLYLTEILNEFSSSDYITPYPFLQTHLLSAKQPALFLLETDDKFYLWQRFENESEMIFENFINLISQINQFAKKYQAHPIQNECFGEESDEFKNLFPYWDESKPTNRKNEFQSILKNNQ